MHKIQTCLQRSSVFISNSSTVLQTFIVCDKFPVMLITIASKLPDYQLTINNSDFCNNTAILVHIIKLVRFTQFVFKIAFTTVSQNEIPDSLIELQSLDITGLLRCIFKSNIGFKIQVRRVAFADNLFYNNSVRCNANPCLFQFLSMKENLDKDLINNTN